MKFKAFIQSFSEERSGVNAEGNRWQVRDIKLVHPYKSQSGSQQEETLLTSCFLAIPENKLKDLQENRVLLDVSVYFSTHTHEGREFQDARLYEISVPVLSEYTD